MGEKVDTKNEAGEKKDAGAGTGGAEKADGGPITVVLKLDLHCDGCAKKVQKSIRNLEGVESVKADSVSNKVTVTGKVDPTRIKERVEFKTKKKVEIISPQPKKDAGGENKAGDKPPEKNSGDKKPKEPESTTVVLTIPLHCDGCINKIKRIISKTDGVQSITIDANKNLVTVKGTMNIKELTPYLKEKLKRNVDIVPPKKEDNKGSEKKDENKVEGGDDKKEKEGNNDDSEKKKNDEAKVLVGGNGAENVKNDEVKATGGGGEKTKNDEVKATSGGGEKTKNDEVKATGGSDQKKGIDGESKTIDGGGGDKGKNVDVVNKSEYYRNNSYAYTVPAYNQNYHNQDYGVPNFYSHGYVNESYANQGYVMEYSCRPPPPPSPINLQDPRVSDIEMFNVENPNACSVM